MSWIRDIHVRGYFEYLHSLSQDARDDSIAEFCRQLNYEDLLLIKSFVESRFRMDFCSEEGLLPPELAVHIFSFLTVDELGRVGQVSRKWREISSSNVIWRRHCEKTFQHVFSEPRFMFIDRVITSNWRKNFSILRENIIPLHELARTYFTAAISSKGDLYMWGAVTERVTLSGVEGNSPRKVNIPNDEKIISISCGQIHYVAVTTSGKAISCGVGRHGRLGRGDESDLPYPEYVCGMDGLTVRNVSAGVAHSGAVTNDGKLYMWGCGGKGRLGNGTQEAELVPKPVSFALGQEPVRFSQVSCGAYHTLALATDRSVYSWGFGACGRLGHANTEDTYTPQKIESLREATMFISAGWEHSCAVTVCGNLYTWGVGLNGQLGSGSLEDMASPLRILFSEDTKIVVASAGGWFTTAIDSNGLLYTWGRGTNGQLGHGDTRNKLKPQVVKSLRDNDVFAITVSAAGTHTMVVDIEGNVYTFGLARRGQLGHGNYIDTDVPLKVSSLDNVKAAGVYYAGDLLS